MQNKGERILKYFEIFGRKKVDYVLYEIQKAVKQSQSGQPASLDIFLAILTHFSERSEVLFDCCEVGVNL